MHISEGVLSAPVLIGGGIICAGFTAIGLRNMKNEEIPKVSILTATFFVASLIHVPLGPSSVHLILNGLIGLLLGLRIFPALLVALFFQAILFQFGGLTVLGVNTVNMALPGLLVYYICKPMIKAESRWFNLAGGFIAGAGAVFGAGILVALALYFSEKGFASAAKVILLAHIPIMIIEGIITAIAVSFIKRIKPEILLLVLIVPLISTSGFCHRVNIFCYVDGDKIDCSSKFTPGGPVKNGEIIVKSVQTGELLLKTKTDQKGHVSFRIPEKALKNNWDLKVICNAEMGHKNFWIIKADEIAPAKQIEETSQAPKEASSPIEAKGISKKELEAIISKVIAQQLAPIKRDLAELKEPKITSRDVIAGLGYIFGIAGIVMYFLQKKSS